MKTKIVFNFLFIIGALLFSITTPASAFSPPPPVNNPVILSVLGCDAGGENCESGRVATGQTLYVTVRGLTPDELDTARITFDTVSFPTILENSTTGRLSVVIPTDVGLGDYDLSVVGNFDTVEYAAGITVVRGTGGGDEDDPPAGNNRNTGGNRITDTGTGSIANGLDKIKDQFPSGSELTQSRTIGDIIIAVIKILLGILLAVTVLFIIIGGFQFVTSAGNEDQAKKGRKTLTYAIIGLVIVILAYVLVNVVTNAVSGPEL